KVMTMKLVFEKETYRILGAQIVGYEGVDKRIDVIATAIHARIPATELAQLDLAYAPPYSSAKDPVNMAGFMVENISKGILKQWFVEDEPALPRDGSVILLDTRTQREFSRGHAEGFINIPVDELRRRAGELPKGKTVFVMCQSGIRSYIACRILTGLGFDARNFSGGYRYFEAVKRDKRLVEESMPCGADK
ncbi:MAG: CoA-disulfide reductase, partial [Oscillospiraceae bacterium]|nr:CoA-disulfide reductase [Oscillospiraceae bacterium]